MLEDFLPPQYVFQVYRLYMLRLIQKKVITITLRKLMVCQGLKYNTTGNAINEDNP